MDDRDLLQLAAKAAGIAVYWVEYHDQPPEGNEGFWAVRNDGPHNRRSGDGRLWDPLDDNGDALALAVNLRLVVDCDFEVGDRDLATHCCAFDGKTNYAAIEHHRHGPYAATRRAIVRAAAALAHTSSGETK